MKGKIISINISDAKGEKKKPIDQGILVENFGLQGDAHAGDWHRQVSLLADESIERMRQKGLVVGYGDFAENITTLGIDLVNLPIGTKLQIGETILLEVTQIGKQCHSRCAIYYQTGDCVMPREGIFARVLKGGTIRIGDEIEVLKNA